MVARTIGVIQMLPELNAGGVERGTLELSRFLVDQGNRSLVISQGGSMVAQLEREGGRHLQLPYIGEKTPRCLLHWGLLRELFKQEWVDIVHLRSRLPAWVAYLAWKSLPERQRPKLITTFHGFYSINAYSAIMTRGQKVIAISNAVADHLRMYYKVPSTRITVIHRGIDPELFHPSRVGTERIRRMKHKWGYEDDTPILLLPGRVTFWKGHKVFIQALARVEDLSWGAVCVGAFDSASAYCQQLLHLVKDLGLSQRIKFVGHEVDMPAAYSAAELVISAAADEPEAFGRVSIETQAMARPIIASAHGGSLETVIDGQTGWLFPPGDPVGLAEVLRKALSRPDLRQQYGTRGFDHVHAHFTTRKMCQCTLALYEELLAK